MVTQEGLQEQRFSQLAVVLLAAFRLFGLFLAGCEVSAARRETDLAMERRTVWSGVFLFARATDLT